jgi:hypothetical protein
MCVEVSPAPTQLQLSGLANSDAVANNMTERRDVCHPGV